MEEAVIKSGIHWNSSRVSRKVLFVCWLRCKDDDRKICGMVGLTWYLSITHNHQHGVLQPASVSVPVHRPAAGYSASHHGWGEWEPRLVDLRNVLSVPDHHAASSETRILACSSAQNVLQPWVLFCYLCQFPFSSRFFHYSQWVSLGLYN